MKLLAYILSSIIAKQIAYTLKLSNLKQQTYSAEYFLWVSNQSMAGWGLQALSLSDFSQHTAQGLRFT